MNIFSQIMKHLKTRSQLDLMGRYSGGGRPAIKRETPLAIREFHRVYGSAACRDNVWKAREERQHQLNNRCHMYSAAVSN